MEDLEALMAHMLIAVSFNISAHEVVKALEGNDRVLKVIFFNWLLRVLQEL
jgi:hypothetical protein